MRLPLSRFTIRTLPVVAGILPLIATSTALAQRASHIPVHARGVPWAGTATGIVIQLVAVALLAAFVIRLGVMIRPGPYRREGRRTFLEDPEEPIPTSGPTGTADGDRP
jgi:hypothetical protein